MSVLVIQHVPFEGPATLLPLLAARGKGVDLRMADSLSRDETLSCELVILMGGPMGVGDIAAFPWLETELAVVRRFVETGTPMLGICLGAQILSVALGGRVRANPEPEIGWFPVFPTPEARTNAFGALFPEKLDVFHWHGETASVPEGATPLLTSRACRNQAFAFEDRILGLQFHMEVDRPAVERLLTHSAADLHPAPFIQSVDAIRSGGLPWTATRILDRILGRLLKDAAGSRFQTEKGDAMTDPIRKIENADAALLEERGVSTWPIWEKEASVFPWEYAEEETCYILEGDVTVTPENGAPVSLKKGDLATFPKGMKCTWEVTRAVRKHYTFA